MKLSYLERAAKSRHPQTKRLFELMETKRTNLGVVLDVGNAEELLDLAHLLGPEVCLIKTHIDILNDFRYDTMLELKRLSVEHKFLIFEDRKFADSGFIAAKQYAEGIYRIAEWADVINAHILTGPGIIEALAAVGQSKGKGLLLLSEMNICGNSFSEIYAATAVRFAIQYSDFVMGFISGRKISFDDTMVYMTPGVHMDPDGDNQDQTYRTPEEVIASSGSDVILVGRDIYANRDPLEQAHIYKETSYSIYAQGIVK
ncbi:MAG: orotidine-5'-phosphate decarboxylase [Victivallaceae bacterium]